MTLKIGNIAPNFNAETTDGVIHFHEWIGSRWCILFSHPKTFTPVCTTELGIMARMKPQFASRNCRIIGLSVDGVDKQKKWSNDIEDATGEAINFPMIGDRNLAVAIKYGMLPAETAGTSETRTPADDQTVRSVFIIAPGKTIQAILTYPTTAGRNFDEILRVLDSLQLTANYMVSTPANWQQGEDVIIVPTVSDDEAKKKFPQGWKTVKPYMRVVKQPHVLTH